MWSARSGRQRRDHRRCHFGDSFSIRRFAEVIAVPARLAPRTRNSLSAPTGFAIIGCMKELTLRQMEVVRAVMIAGSIQGAANLLHVSAPRISRLSKYTEDGLGFRLFDRRAGVFVPAPEAHAIFAMLNQV
ncbi:LysR family transcriptional regulator [Pseudotabrizicola sediminis]|uniref:LysR family transcriptional regulator n=1 Tax=Pseudotabrizicola sediminis TaxID=2486418 RepID=UPI001FD9E672|nr:LysR family transcriptional regulator [Pseudotabrizicola sediminis]